MYCPKCQSPVKKARLDVYWCEECNTSWLIHKLSYKSLEEASGRVDKEAMAKTFLKPLMDAESLVLPLKSDKT